MSDEKKSSILSASVSFGKAKQPAPAHKKISVPWHVLICSDLGFVSERPEQLRASTFNDFIAEHGVVLRGTVDSLCAGKPVFIEYPVKESTDLYAKKIRHTLPFTAALQSMCDALQGLRQGTIIIDRALALVQEKRDEIPIAAEIYAALKQIQGKIDTPKTGPEAKTKTPTTAAKSSLLDSILDSVTLDTGAEQSAASKSPGDTFTSAIAGNMLTALPVQEIETMIDLLETMIVADITTVLSQPFFSARKAAWLACKQCAKTMGRDASVQISVFSAPSTDISGRFVDALRMSSEAGGVPDIVLLDYPIQFTNAHADALSAVCSIAEANNIMVLASLAADTPLLKQVPHADTVRTMLNDPVYIPYKRFRGNSFARSLCLCAPDGVLTTDDVLPVVVGGCWLALFTLLQKLHDGRSPFDGLISLVDMGLSAEYPLRFSAGMTAAHTEEMAAFGITLLSDRTATTAGVSIITAIDGETVAPNYTSFAYNLLVNRLLAVTTGAVQAAGGNQQTCVAILFKEIAGLLAQYRLLHSEHEVVVTPEGDREISVAINSQKTVDGYPLTIEYSVSV